MLVVVFILTSSVINSINAQITYISTSTANASSGQSFSINKPTGVDVGDIMIMSIAKYSNGNTNNPFIQNDGTAGWTAIYSGTLGGNSDYIVSVMYKVVTENWEPGNYVIVPSSYAPIERAIASIVAYRGVDSSIPMDAIGTFASPTNNSSTITPSGITTTVDNTMVLLMGFNMRNINQIARSFNGWSANSPATFSELFDNGINMVGVGAAEAIKLSAGSTGNGTITLSGNTQNRGGMFLALKPSPPKQFRTKYTGNWTNLGLWEQSTDGGSTWVNATTIPTNSDGLVTILSGHTITIPNGTNATASEMSVNGTISVVGNATITPDAATFNSGSTYRHDRNGGTIPAATWDANATCIVYGLTNSTPSGLNQTFGNLTWQCNSQSSNLNINNSITCQGDFTLISTNNRELRLANNATDRTFDINGNFILSSGIFILNNSSGNGTVVNVNGNYTQTNGTLYLCDDTGNGTMNINGNLSQSGGIFDFYHAGNSMGQGIVNLSGNLNHTASTQTLYTGGQGARNGIINFVGTSPQTVYFQDVDGATWVTYNVSSSSTVELLSNIELMGDNSNSIFYADFVVDGTIDFGVNSLIDGASQTDASHFVLNSGAKLITANSSGINGSLSSGTMNLSFSSNADYEFQGVTTGTFTTTPTPATVADLIINNGSGVTLSQPLSATNLVFTQGILTTSTNILTINSASGSSISGYGASSYVNGPLNLEIGSSTNGTYLYPIGDGSYNPFDLVDFNSTGTMVLQAEVIDADCGGTTGSGITTLNTNRYWQISVVQGGGNFTNTKIRLTESSSLPSNAVMGFSSTLAGSYNAISTSPPIGATILSDNHLQQGYFVIGQASTDPTLSVVPSSIDFGYVASGSTDTQTFTLNGNNLDGTDVTITGSSDFQVSTDGSPLSNSVTISGYGTSISKVVTVQFTPSAANTNYSDNILVSGGGAADDGVVAVSGNSNITYCEPSVSNNMRYIDRIRMVNDDFDNDNTGFSPGGYGDYTDTYSTDLIQGESNVEIDIEMNVNTAGAYVLSFWVDWNQDGDFDDTGENVYCDNSVTVTSDRISFDVPGDANIGETRLRIRLMYNGNCSSSCDNFDYGEVEDYTINVIQPVTITTAPISPLTYCPGSSVSVPYSISGSFNAGNVFTAQLSDENGSFASPTNIGSVTSQSSGTISATIPSSGIVDGNGYRIRVVSSNPVFTGTDNGSDISIGSLELITSPGSQCKYGSDVTISVSASSSIPGIFRWYSDAAGTNLLQESSSSESSSEYTATISSNQTYYVQIESGSCTSTLTPVTAFAIIPPTLNATAGGTFCVGGTLNLYSDGSGYDNIYWDGPNSFYSIDEDPVINNATTDMSGTYTVHTSTLSGVNLVSNGDFEDGNVGFTSEYDYKVDIVGINNELQPEGAYTVTNLPSNVHNNFCNTCTDKTSGSGLQMVINGSTVSGDSIWMQKVNVVLNTEYQFSYYVQSVVNNDDDSPSELQFYVNGIEAGPVYVAEATTGLWTQFFYNWNSGSNSAANLSLVNRNTVGGGNDFALDDIVFQHTCTAEASVEVSVGSGFVPDVTITADPGETICDGDLISFTATPINGGTTPSYQWYQNGTPVTNEINSTFTPATIAHLDEIYCEMTTSLSCISGSATASSDVLTIAVIEPPTAIAGGNLFSCGLSPVEITSGASATNYSSIEWTSTGSGVFSDAASLTACTYTPSATDITTGSVTITLTASGNSPCGDEIDTKILTFTDPIDVKADYLFTDYCPQFLAPVSFNNDDDPRPPGRTELNFVLVPLNASASWQFELDFNIVATPGVSGTLSIDELAVIENGTEITATGGVYTADASTDTIFINALVVNQPGHSLDVIIDAINVTSAGCTENEEDNNTSTITIYPMPAIGKFE